MISYNQKDFESMRQDAMKRIREMHSYAQTSDSPPQNNASPKTNSHQNNSSAKTQTSSQPTNNATQNQAKQSSNNNNRQQGNNNHRTNSSNPFAQLFGSNLGGFNRAKQKSAPPPVQKPPSPPPQQETPDIAEDIKGKIDGFLKDFNIDEEKIILALLIYSLYKNNADYKLLLALAYLII